VNISVIVISTNVSYLTGITVVEKTASAAKPLGLGLFRNCKEICISGLCAPCMTDSQVIKKDIQKLTHNIIITKPSNYTNKTYDDQSF
jgi:hypothetical protein